MIIFNEKEMKSLYTSKECWIIDINSPLSFTEIVQSLIDGEELDREKVAIAAYHYGQDELTFQNKQRSERDASFLFNREYSSDELEEHENIEYERPNEFKIFELFNFGQSVAMDFTLQEISNEELLKECKAAMGCLPTLMDEPLTASEIQKYSAAGKQLILMNHQLGKGNPSPTIQEIDMFLSMNDYERRLITKNKIHPYKAFKYAEALKKTIAPKYIFNAYDYSVISYQRATEHSDFEVFAHDLYQCKSTPEFHQKIEQAFQNEFHFVPRVADEYIYGKIIKTRTSYEQDNNLFSMTIGDDFLQEGVHQFNRTSVSKIANTKSPWLLAISDEINFSECSTQITDVLGAYLTKYNIYPLTTKNFFQWLAQHKEVKPTELLTLIEKYDSIAEYSLEKDAKALITEAKNQRGMNDAMNFAHNSNWNLYGKPFDFSKNEIAIKGRHTIAKQGGITMRMLAADDYANFTVGYDTTCCQHYGDAGESCVFKYTTDPFAAAVVIEENDKVKAQAFIWTDEVTSTLVFDNVEFTGANNLDTQLSRKYLNIIYEWANAMPYKNVHIGVGYNASMNGWGKKVDFVAKLPTTVDDIRRTSWGDGNCYSDYHRNNARSIKKDGEMILNRTTMTEIMIETAPDETTRWDELTKPELSFMLNDCTKVPEERIAFAKRFLENPTPELQLEVIKRCPNSVAALENPCEEVQLYILNNYPDLISLVNNKIPALKNKDLFDHPEHILDIENPTDDEIEVAVTKNGMLIKNFPNAAYPICKIAVTQNPMAIQFLSTENRTEELQVLAASNEAKSITTYNDPCIPALLTAIQQEPSLISTIKTPRQEVKLAAIRRLPDLVLDIKNPPLEGETSEEHNQKLKELWTEAVTRNGYLIRNCGRSFPELRMTAIRQNPFAIGCLPDVTHDEIDLAVSGNAKAYQFIRNKEDKAYGYQKALEIYGEEHVPVKKVYYAPNTIELELA